MLETVNLIVSPFVYSLSQNAPSRLLDAIGSRLHGVNLSAASVCLLPAVGSFTSAQLILNKLPHSKLKAWLSAMVDHSLNYAKQEDAENHSVSKDSPDCTVSSK